MNLEQMQEQYQGKRLPELVRAIRRTMNQPMILLQAVRGTFIEFDDSQRDRLEAWTDAYLQDWLSADVAEMDLGELLGRTLRDIDAMLKESGLTLEDKRRFDLFHAMTLKVAQRVDSDTAVRALYGP